MDGNFFMGDGYYIRVAHNFKFPTPTLRSGPRLYVGVSNFKKRLALDSISCYRRHFDFSSTASAGCGLPLHKAVRIRAGLFLLSASCKGNRISFTDRRHVGGIVRRASIHRDITDHIPAEFWAMVFG